MRLPIVGLEAINYELPMILSDISANREIAEADELKEGKDVQMKGKFDKMSFAVHMCQAISIIIGSLVFPYCQGNFEYKTASIKNKEESIQNFVKSFNKTLNYYDRIILDQYNLKDAKEEKEIAEFKKRIDDGIELLNNIDSPYETACSMIVIHFSDENIQDRAKRIKIKFDELADTEWINGVNRQDYEEKRKEMIHAYDDLLEKLTLNLEQTRVSYGFPS